MRGAKSPLRVQSISWARQAQKSVEHLIVAETEKPIAFMGVQNGRLEMLFITPEERGKGMGKQLLQYGIKPKGSLS